MNTAIVNLPATSDPEAMTRYPDARNAERDALIDCVKLFPGMTTLDIQSAAGYLSDEIYARQKGNVTCICIEPSEVLRGRLNPAFQAFDNPVENFFSVKTGSVDAVLGLAGLHHSDSHQDTINESFRVLKNGGEIAICDVIEGSGIASWLNDFVHENNSTGHFGNFVSPGSMKSMFIEAGFSGISEETKNVPWKFNSRTEVIEFFKGLFDLRCDNETIDKALDQYFNLEEKSDYLLVNWPLLYCHGRKSS